MTLTLELTPGLEAKAHQNAERNGKQVEDYLRQLLANAPVPIVNPRIRTAH